MFEKLELISVGIELLRDNGGAVGMACRMVGFSCMYLISSG